MNAVKITVIPRGKISSRIELYEVGIHTTPEFNNEPAEKLSSAARIEFLAQKIKEEFLLNI